MNDLPTPDELGEKLKAGEITEAEAIEIMSERARREALRGLYGPPTDNRTGSGPSPEDAASTRRAGIWILIGIIVALSVLYILLQFLDRG